MWTLCWLGLAMLWSPPEEPLYVSQRDPGWNSTVKVSRIAAPVGGGDFFFLLWGPILVPWVPQLSLSLHPLLPKWPPLGLWDLEKGTVSHSPTQPYSSFGFAG